MKKKMSVCLAAIMAAAAMTACGGSAGQKETTAAPAAEKTEAAAPAESGKETEAASAETAEWPTDNITLEVPAKAGGGTDVLVRQFAMAMEGVTGESFVVVNDDTGNGTVAAETIRNAKPDGTKFLIANTGLCGIIASGQYPHRFDEFEMCGLITTPTKEGAAIFVPANSPYQTFEEFEEFVKANPDELVAGVQSNGAGHYTTLLLGKELGTSFTIVDSGGNADRTTALMGNTIDFSIMNTTGEDQYVKSGDLRCLAILGPEKSDLIPDAPLISDFGYEPIDLSMCATMLAPKGTDPAVIKAVEAVLEEASKNQDLQDAYQKLGSGWEYMTAEESSELVNSIQSLYDEAYELIK